MRRSGIEPGLEDTLPWTAVEPSAAKGQGGFAHKRIGMGFDACPGTRRLLAGGPADGSRQPALILILANQT
jgi:hypothetical protein